MEAKDRFGDYTIIKRIASGGMAEVYLAHKSGISGFSKPVAVKVILPHLSENERFTRMFLDEARLVVHLHHAHIAQTLDLGEVDGNYFIAMEFVHGEDLQKISVKTRKSGRLLPLPYAAKIISQIAEGLYYAHKKTDNQGRSLGIVHRDISPHNVLLSFDGQAKLVDFGVAKARITYQEEEGSLKGKFSYMSPEQVRGMPIDPRSDIFSLGTVLWEICTGANLFRESSELMTMESIIRKQVPKPRDLRGDMPPDLEAIILKALAKRSVDRFDNAYHMHVALERHLSQSGWTVGTPHLSEFMKKLFPETYQETSRLLADEQKKIEAADQKNRDTFIPWEPYGETPSGLNKTIPGVEKSKNASSKKSPERKPPAQPSASRTILRLLLLLLLAIMLGIGTFALIEAMDIPLW